MRTTFICARVAGLFLLGVIVGFAGSIPGQGSGLVPLERTAAAPYGAVGAAQFIGADKLTKGHGQLTLKVQGLNPGRYRVVLVSKVDGHRVSVGTILLVDPTAAPDAVANENVNQRTSSYQSSSIDLQTGIALPTGLEIGHVAKVIITDDSGTVILSGKVAR